MIDVFTMAETEITWTKLQVGMMVRKKGACLHPAIWTLQCETWLCAGYLGYPSSRWGRPFLCPGAALAASSDDLNS